MTELDGLDLASPLSDASLRDAFSRVAASVVIVTTRNSEGQPRAVTVSSFTSVSLEPPLVLFCLSKFAFHHDVFATADTFAINCLGADQKPLSNRFAEERLDDFRDIETFNLETGSPAIRGSLATLDCTTESRHQAGDHVIIIGRICALAIGTADDPLLYFRRAYRRLTPSAVG